MTCSVASDRYSWYVANKATQFQWRHAWWYPQVIEMTPNVSGQTLRLKRVLRPMTDANDQSESIRAHISSGSNIVNGAISTNLDTEHFGPLGSSYLLLGLHL
jgi:hypothetical protein